MKRATEPELAVRSRRTKSSGAVVPHQARWHQRLVARAVFCLERLLTSSLRLEWQDESGLFDSPTPQPLIFCLWHNRLALSMAIYRKYVRKKQPSRRLAALVSASKDGALLARILQNFDVEPVRGSSSRRGSQALLELTSLAGRGYDLSITPDGPRGPRYVVQEGVVALARLTGLPIVPVTIHVRRKLRFDSWDAFQIPWPLTRCKIVFGPPLNLPRHASDAERQNLRAELERRLREGADD